MKCDCKATLKVFHLCAEPKASGIVMAQTVSTEEVAKASGIKVHKLSELSADQVQGLRARPRIDFTSIFGTVSMLFLIVSALHATFVSDTTVSLYWFRINIKCRF